MRFIVGDGDEGEQGGGEGGPAREEEGQVPEQGADVRAKQGGEREGVGEGEGVAVGGGRESVAREGEEGRDGGGEAEGSRDGDGSKRKPEEEEQEAPERLQRGADDGRRKRKRAADVRYGEEGSEEPQTVGEGVTVYCPHKVRAKRRRYVGTVEEMIVQKDCTGHQTKAAIVQFVDQEEDDEERLP